jgi:anti-anti-sigma regulatory factor
VIITARGELGIDHALELRQVLVHGVRKLRPARLVVDLAAVVTLDPINLGTLAAACELGDDRRVAIFLDNPSKGGGRRPGSGRRT